MISFGKTVTGHVYIITSGREAVILKVSKNAARLALALAPTRRRCNRTWARYISSRGTIELSLLGLVSTARLGYGMPVEIKTMLTDDDAVPPRVSPAQGRTFGVCVCGGVYPSRVPLLHQSGPLCEHGVVDVTLPKRISFIDADYLFGLPRSWSRS